MVDSTAQVDARLTAHRREIKFLVGAEAARRLVTELDGRLAPHRHRGEGANRLPAAQHWVTTIYFDTPGRALFGAARRDAEHLKVRARAYYDVHPALTETATDPRQLVRAHPTLWLEIKRRTGAHTGKRRLAVPPEMVPALLGGGRTVAGAPAGEATPFLDALDELRQGAGEPLAADCVVNYRRHAWQDDASGLRVTLDSGLAYFAVPPSLWSPGGILVRAGLGVPVAVEDRRVVEVKSGGEPPAWLLALLGAPTSFSKFHAASSAVHG